MRVFWALIWVLCAGAAQAVEIGPGKPGLCLYTLSGQIAPGDADKLRALPIDRPVTWPDIEDGRWAAICLDSPGGSLPAGLELASYVLERGLGTVVDDGAECLSACALVFMFGTAYQLESNALIHRRLHVGGRLGFHQPDLTLDRSRAYSVDDVAAAFDLAITATLEFLALAARPRPDTPRPFVDADLLEAMLQHKGQDFFEIDTVNKAGRWGIDLIGWQEPEFTEEGFFNACQNMTSWNTQLATGQIPYAKMGFDASIDRQDGDGGFVDGRRYRLSFAGMQTYDCEAGIIRRWNGETTPALCGYRENLSSQVGPDSCLYDGPPDRWIPIPGAALLPASTRLSDLRRARGVASPVASGPTPCKSVTGQARVVNVQSFTSLRQVNDTNADRIDQLPLGSRYRVGAPEGNWRLPQHQACTALCQAAETGQPYSQSALDACIDVNWLWFRITGPSGQTGYASAKYLDY